MSDIHTSLIFCDTQSPVSETEKVDVAVCYTWGSLSITVHSRKQIHILEKQLQIFSQVDNILCIISRPVDPRHFMRQISLDDLFLLTLASIMLLQSQIDLTTESLCEHLYVHHSLYLFFFNAEEKLTNMFLLNFFSRLFLKIQKLPKV